MTEYEVHIDERFTHTLVVTAETEADALDAAYKLLSDGMTPEEEKEADYSFESDGYTGQHSVSPL